METIEIDATNRILGRLATEIADKLRGKDKPSYRPDKLSEIIVSVTNASKIKVSGQKLKQKIYYSHSGYPGGLKSKNLETMLQQKPKQALTLAVQRMLPNNRLRRQYMKRLRIIS